MKTPSNVVVLLLAACSCAAPTPSEYICSPTIDTTFEPLPLGTPPVWRDPGFGIRPPGVSIDHGVWLPWDYADSSVYPLSMGDLVYARLVFGVGPDDVTEAITSYVLIEGRVAEVVVDGVRTRRIEVPLRDGLAQIPFTIPASELAPGLNQVDVIHFLHRRGNWRLLVSSPFTVANGSLEPQLYEDTPGLERAPYMPDSTTRAYRRIDSEPRVPEAGIITWVPIARPLDDPTTITLRIQATSPWSRCPGDARLDRMVIVAFRDLEPVPMGELDRIVATLPAGEQRVYRYEMALFPPGEQHNYSVAVLGGFGRPARTVYGGEAPWVVTDELIQVWWGWSP